ncbi:hypothetical protein M5G27_18120 [Pseudomonas shahriarae]|uniref:Uncharacterized protein n=1 Tax=Pseudomonas shahriarae TaxID=2745512 RepID=A0A9X4C3U1_9PSED|nr:hypothetical protein [Pseudomonas shahriarae]MDD1009395.1 hypothetical protein [Pseudomonas shahriarae]
MKSLSNEQILASEISSYEEMLKTSIQLKARVDETVTALETSYSNIIGAKSIFEEIKKENIEELRLYRQTIAREVGEITQAVKQLKSNLDSKSLSDLREYVSLCERLKVLQDTGFKFPA